MGRMNSLRAATTPSAAPRQATTPFAAKKIVAHRHLADSEAEMLFELYLAGFESMKTRAAARHAFSREEFLDELADERICKHVAYDNAGCPIGMLTLTKDLDAVPWISPQYFEARYPDHFARNAIYYLGYVIVHPNHQGTRLLEHLLSTRVFIPLAQEKAVLGFDISGFHNGPSGFARRLQAMALRHTPTAVMTPIDTQTYFDFTWT
jgi:hypothetical protein